MIFICSLFTDQCRSGSKMSKVVKKPKLSKQKENKPVDDQDIPKVDDTPSKISMCVNCGFESEIPRIFQKHMNSIRKCPECSKVFCGRFAKRQHESHQKKHEIKPVKPKKPKIPFMCVHCDKQFDHKSRLKHHLVVSKCGRRTPPKTPQMDDNGVVFYREMTDLEVQSFQMVKDNIAEDIKQESESDPFAIDKVTVKVEPDLYLETGIVKSEPSFDSSIGIDDKIKLEPIETIYVKTEPTD